MIFRMHQGSTFREFLAWYQSVTRIKLCERWTDEDYAGIGSFEDKDTPYDTHNQDGSHVVLGPVLDHVVCFLSILYEFCSVVSLY
jgi:hypothetical protein